MNWELIQESWPVLVAAVPDTVALAFSSLAIGFVCATAIALMRLSGKRALWGFAYGYVYIFRSTPLLVQIFLIYYGSGQFRPFLEDIGLWTFFREPWFCAILALTLNTARICRYPKFSQIAYQISRARFSQEGYRRNEISSSRTAAMDRNIP